MSVYRRGKVWWIDFVVDGKRVRKPVGGSKKKATDALDRIKGKIASDDYKPDDGYGDCQNHLDSDLTDTMYVDPEIPDPQAGFTYLVAFVDGSGPTGLGNTAAGLPRVVTMVCP